MNVKSAQEYWNELYQGQVYKSGMGPRSFLKEHAQKLFVGKTLDVAMGEGQNAVYLAGLGHEVSGFDLSDTAVKHAVELAKTKEVEIVAKRADLDLYIFGLMEFDNIIMFHYRPSVTRYYGEFVRALKQGGYLMVEAELIQGMNEIIPRGEEYRDLFFRPNELLKHLKDLRILFYREDVIGGKHLVQCIAQKPTDKDAAKYNLFDMQIKDHNAAKSPQLQLAESLFKK